MKDSPLKKRGIKRIKIEKEESKQRVRFSDSEAVREYEVNCMGISTADRRMERSMAKRVKKVIKLVENEEEGNAPTEKQKAKRERLKALNEEFIKMDCT